ncbi:D-alanine--D-alanine ligase [soil metagenome]
MDIILLAGGPSAERDVSLSSGKAILNALRELGHSVKVIDPVHGSEQLSEDKIFSKLVSGSAPSISELSEIHKITETKEISSLSLPDLKKADLVFLGLHGKFGEDGRIQTMLDMMNIKYTGSGALSSTVSMDKIYSKVILAHNNIKTPKWIELKENYHILEEIYKKIKNELGFPCVIKPNDEGSTVGLTILKEDATVTDLEEAMLTAFGYSERVFAEEFIKGRELTVPVIGEEAFPVIEIRPEGGFYDYQHKYTKGMTSYLCPAELPDSVEEEVKDLALRSHIALRCEVYSRVDFILSEKNELYCLEVNTLPGMTETSLVPKSAAAKGMNFTKLIERLIQLSLNKYN